MQNKKINTLLKIFFLFCLGIFSPNLSRAAVIDATLLFNPATASSTLTGSNISLVAQVDPGSNTTEGINAVDANITFSPSVIHLVSFTPISPFIALNPPNDTAIATANITGTLSVALLIAGDDITSLTDIATLEFTPQGLGTNSLVAFAPSANAAVNNGQGTPVVATRENSLITITEFSKNIGIFSNGAWYLDLNGNGVWNGSSTDIYYSNFGKGVSGAVPVTGDWNGDGTSEIGIFTDGAWYLDLNGNGVWNGSSTDIYYSNFGKGV
jgi:hypothetical protein